MGLMRQCHTRGKNRLSSTKMTWQAGISSAQKDAGCSCLSVSVLKKESHLQHPAYGVLPSCSIEVIGLISSWVICFRHVACLLLHQHRYSLLILHRKIQEHNRLDMDRPLDSLHLLPVFDVFFFVIPRTPTHIFRAIETSNAVNTGRHPWGLSLSSSASRSSSSSSTLLHMADFTHRHLRALQCSHCLHAICTSSQCCCSSNKHHPPMQCFFFCSSPFQSKCCCCCCCCSFLKRETALKQNAPHQHKCRRPPTSHNYSSGSVLLSSMIPTRFSTQTLPPWIWEHTLRTDLLLLCNHPPTQHRKSNNRSSNKSRELAS